MQTSEATPPRPTLVRACTPATLVARTNPFAGPITQYYSGRIGVSTSETMICTESAIAYILQNGIMVIANQCLVEKRVRNQCMVTPISVGDHLAAARLQQALLRSGKITHLDFNDPELFTTLNSILGLGDDTTNRNSAGAEVRPEEQRRPLRQAGRPAVDTIEESWW